MDKLKMHSKDKTQENFEILQRLFPNAVTETITGYDDDGKAIVERAIDKDVLQQEINAAVVEGKDERYQFTWPDKKRAIVSANAPINKTLRPCREESVDFDNTENLYIEGDNLEVLKLLQETYLGKIKMIYIDPPYNTGHDFVYNDKFSVSADEWDEMSGDLDEYGNRLTQNTESNGRFHTDWLNMIYPRLKIARDLLTDDGLILISIDDNELYNLEKVCNEVFGEYNFVACLVYDKNRKNDAKYFSIGHEYILVYFKNSQVIYDNGIIFREQKEGVEEVKKEFSRLRMLYNDNWELVGDGLKKLYASWAKEDDRKPLARFTKVDEFGPYRDDGNISWPGGGGPKYEVIHPVTQKPCKCPDAGWRFPTPQRMQEEIDRGRVVFGDDETTLPRIRRNLFDFDSQVMRSVHFSYAQTTTLEFNKLFDNRRVFENPKSTEDLKKLIRYISANDRECIVLDFFSGSATTAHAVMKQNFQDILDDKKGKRKFIMVQLPEKTDEKSEAYKAGYKNICEIGKDRIRRAGEMEKKNVYATAGSSLKWNDERKAELGDDYVCPEDVDIGFRVLKLDSSNMKDVYYNPADFSKNLLDTTIDNIKEDRTPEDLLFQVMLDLGVLLSSKIEETEIAGKKVFNVADGFLIACFDNDVNEEVITAVAKQQPIYFVMRDSSLSTDTTATNFDQIFETYSPDTVRKVI